MGRRKTRKKPPPKPTATRTVPKVFDCPFCAHKKVVTCNMDHEQKIGRIRCTVCGVEYQMVIHNLMQPIDLYSEWIDRCYDEADASGQE